MKHVDERLNTLAWSMTVLGILLAMFFWVWNHTDKPLSDRAGWELEERQEMVVASGYEYVETKQPTSK